MSRKSWCSRSLLTLAILATATGCYAQAEPVQSPNNSQSAQPSTVYLVPAFASELAGAQYCTAENRPEIDNTQVCLHIGTHDNTTVYSLETGYLWERGVIVQTDNPYMIAFYPADHTDLVLSSEGTAYTIRAYHNGDGLVIITPSNGHITFNLTGYTSGE
jgi:hypothetical protein